MTQTYELKKENPEIENEMSSFLDYISENNFMRMTKVAGHKWFRKMDINTYSNEELYRLFKFETENHKNKIAGIR